MNYPIEPKIKILMVLGNTGRGGAQTYAVNVLRNIDRSRFQIDFAVNLRHKDGYENEIEQLGSKIHIIPKFKGVNYFEYIRRFDEVLGQGGYHIVHGHVSSSAVLYLKVAKRRGCVTIAHSHSAGYRGNAAERIIKKVFTAGAKQQADYWFGCSELAARRMFGDQYKLHENYYDIPNAIVVDRYRFDQGVRQHMRSSLGLCDEDILYGHVGSFSAPKNHRFLIQIFEELCKRQGKRAHLVLLGEGQLQSAIRQQISNYGLEKQVVFTGNVGNVNEYLMAMDAMIFPSLFEGFPIAVVEAQAAGVFSLVSDSITKDVNVTPCVIPMSLSQSAEQWADRLITIPKTDRVAANDGVAKTVFNMRNSIDKLMELYEQMEQKRRDL